MKMELRQQKNVTGKTIRKKLLNYITSKIIIKKQIEGLYDYYNHYT